MDLPNRFCLIRPRRVSAAPARVTRSPRLQSRKKYIYFFQTLFSLEGLSTKLAFLSVGSKVQKNSTRRSPMFRFLTLAIAAMLMLSPAVMAQTATGILQGRVTDDSGAAVPDARITIENERT